MREMARTLNLSVATVSLALRNHPDVAEATRQRVMEEARRTGYRLNPTLTQMMSHVRKAERARYTETLAWVNFGEREDRFSAEGLDYLHYMWEGARARALELGYMIDQFWFGDPEMTGRRMNAILTSRGIRGIMVPPLQRSIGHIAIPWRNYAAVALTYTLPRPPMHRVVPDHHLNMQVILRHLTRRGYRRPGLLLTRKFDERLGNRFRAAYYYHQQMLRKRDRLPVKISPPTGYEKEVSQWLKQHRPDVVITVGALRNVRELEMGDPEYSASVGVILLGFARTDAGFAAVEENPRQIGSTGVDHLVAALGRNERGAPEFPQTILIPGVWVEGETLPWRVVEERKSSPGS